MTEQNITILCIEDDKVWSGIIERAVERDLPNVQLKLAPNFNDAVKILENEGVDVVLTDMEYPDSSGRLNATTGFILI